MGAERRRMDGRGPSRGPRSDTIRLRRRSLTERGARAETCAIDAPVQPRARSDQRPAGSGWRVQPLGQRDQPRRRRPDKRFGDHTLPQTRHVYQTLCQCPSESPRSLWQSGHASRSCTSLAASERGTNEGLVVNAPRIEYMMRTWRASVQLRPSSRKRPQHQRAARRGGAVVG